MALIGLDGYPNVGISINTAIPSAGCLGTVIAPPRTQSCVVCGWVSFRFVTWLSVSHIVGVFS